MKLDWKPKPVISAVEIAIDKAADKGAGIVQADAKAILMSRAKHPTGHLASEIDVIKSKFKNGGYIVAAQAPGHYTGKYHAVFVEVGTKKMQAIPYLRPALKKNKQLIRNLFDKDEI